MTARLSSSTAFALRPTACGEEGLPQLSASTSFMRATTSGSGCVVAALSKYVSVSSMRLPSRTQPTRGRACRRCRIFDSAHHSNPRFIMWVNRSQFSAETSIIGKTAVQSWRFHGLALRLHNNSGRPRDFSSTPGSRPSNYKPSSQELFAAYWPNGASLAGRPSFATRRCRRWILKRSLRSARFSRLLSESLA